MVTGTLEGVTVTACAVHLPAWGVWWADVDLDQPAALSGAVTLALAGLELSGTVMSGGPWQGRARYRIAGGKGTWGKTITVKSYTNDAGVKRRTVIRDAAAACGETVDESTITGSAGSHYAREAGPASRALELLAPQAWYVGEDGVTRLGAREETTYEGDATRTDSDPSRLTLTLAADDLSSLVPGVLVSDGQGGTFAAVDVVHRLTPDKLRTTVWGDLSDTSRPRSALQRIIAAMQVADRYRGIWEYRITKQTGERLDMQPVRVSSGMPDLRHIKVRPGAPGLSADHAIGSKALVAFINAEPGRPVVVGFDDADAVGFKPNELYLLEGALKVARDTDPVAAGHLIFDAATVTLYWAPGTPGLPGTPLAYVTVATNPNTPNPPAPGTAGTALVGVITDGRAEVLA